MPDEPQESLLKAAGEMARPRFLWFLASLIDGLFLAGWAALQWGVDWFLGLILLSGISAGISLMFQVIFAIATIAPVILWIYEDTMKMIRRVRYNILEDMAYRNVGKTLWTNLESRQEEQDAGL